MNIYSVFILNVIFVVVVKRNLIIKNIMITILNFA
jgi:hypothetical protein